ncbi:MAG: tRNA (adenosine(37)-N6)-threonylcarbamoyltransferase complex ATPase subunit type 1 TsaE [Planctomycetia bacterium]|nr:tRNA (adenosine(37)-N6)-threonylcarbamoyltransferase complex ATPase subunit type 1 TsaE [Planctomycetia bacterium]
MTSVPETAAAIPPSRELAVAVHDLRELDLLAARLAAALPRPAFIAIHGDLGAGKTTFVKAVAAAAGIDPAEVVSPTFGLVHEHASREISILHADMYRLHAPDDLWEIGWHDAVVRATWVFVEWPERIAAALPADRLDVTIKIDAPTARTFVFQAHGPRHDTVLDALRAAA